MMKTIFDAKYFILLDAQFGIRFYCEGEKAMAKAELKRLRDLNDSYRYCLVKVMK